MKVIFCAYLCQYTDCESVTLEISTPVTAHEFWEILTGNFPILKLCRKSTRLAVNGSYLISGELIHINDEVALIPPVSGG